MRINVGCIVDRDPFWGSDIRLYQAAEVLEKLNGGKSLD